MSFPSVVAVARERGYHGQIPPEAAPAILLEAVKRDCPEAIEFLHKKGHEADDNNTTVTWDVPLGTPLFKQLVRIHAAGAVRELVEQHVCHGQRLEFYNCHIGTVGGEKLTLEERALLQIQYQDGTLASVDC